MIVVTYFIGFNKPTENKLLSTVIDEIKNGTYKCSVNEIRNELTLGNNKNAEALKKNLLAFTPSATFKGGRTNEFVENYNKLIVLDFDDIPDENYDSIYAKIKECEYTFGCFRSPSGNGIKILCKVSSEMQQHYIAFVQLSAKYENLTGVKIDPSGKDVARLCYVSFDPNAYFNEDSKVFHVEIQQAVNSSKHTGKHSGKRVANTGKSSDLYKRCIKITNKNGSYIEGNRNNYVHHLANNCNRAGIGEFETLGIITSDFDLDIVEIKRAVESAYKNTYEFGKGLELSKSNGLISNDSEDEIDDKAEDLMNLPCLPDVVFQHLPSILKKGSEVLNSDREKDVFLLGALVVLSGILQTVEGTYDQRTVYPNLNCFVIAPAASGKSSFSFAKALGMEYQEKLKKTNKIEFERYEKELRIFKQKINKKTEIQEDEVEPIKPPFKMLFFPANSSSASLFNLLKDNNEMGIFFETEADSMGNTLKQDWGGYSDLLRKAFHHETASYSRKGNNELIEINKPRLSTGLTGTPSQVENLIRSAEDGLFSRFIFYTFYSNAMWRDVSPSDKRPNLTKHFENLSIEVLSMVDYLEKYPTEFDLTTEQWRLLNQIFSGWLSEVSTFVSIDATSIVKRLGLILFRITMILSCLRKFEKYDTSTKIYCETVDFDAAMLMSDVFLKHSIYMFKTLPKSEKVRSKMMKQFYDNLPESFQRKDAIALGAELNIKERTVDKYLKNLCDGHFIVNDENNYGNYIKV